MSKKNGEYYYFLMSNRDRMRYKGNVSSQDKNIDEILKKNYENFDDFLIQSFDWKLSLQGKTYWKVLSKQIQTENKLKLYDLYIIIFFVVLFLFLFLFNT